MTVNLKKHWRLYDAVCGVLYLLLPIVIVFAAAIRFARAAPV